MDDITIEILSTEELELVLYYRSLPADKQICFEILIRKCRYGEITIEEFADILNDWSS
ncbi:MAG: hypothetical protein U0L12_03630 [Ruminococcus sp.]|nr:hypothetical protein [Ruminococcus sp.]